MLPRDRVFACLNFEPSDVAPLECNVALPGGAYEHGVRMLELFRQYPHDFADFSNLTIPAPNPEFLQPDGSYDEVQTDAWGVTWRLKIYGMYGHPERRPLDDWSALSTWHPPAVPATSGPEFEAARQQSAEHRRRYFLKAGWGGIFEILHAVRRFEDVLMDLALNTKEINRLADQICEYQIEMLHYHLAVGVNGIGMGDDWGTQETLIISRDLWRRFFLPRYERMVAPALEAGVPIFFHSCGAIDELLPDLADLGVRAVWPQINLYDWDRLHRTSQELHMAIALHPERSHLMTTGTPEEVTRHIDQLAATFRPQEGGSWFYLEIDPGFPRANVEAMFAAVGKYR
jgi:uroporphyrinogen decarboxylase